MKNFLDLAKSRHSVRNYNEKEVEQARIDKILEAGRIAPSAANKQPCRFLVLKEKESIKKLQKACNSHGATLVIIVCSNKHSVWVRPFDNASMVDIDASIATDHMMMCVQDLGLSSCWITYFKPDILRDEFNIPEELIPINILAIGYGKETPKSIERYSQDRNSMEDIVHYNSF